MSSQVVTEIQHKVLAEFARQKDMLFLWGAVFFATGIAAYFQLSHEPSLHHAVILLCICAVFLKNLWHHEHITFGMAVLRLALLFSFLSVLGAALAIWRTEQMDAPVIKKDTRPATLSGLVLDIEKLPDSNRIILGELDIEDIAKSDTPYSVRLHLRDQIPFPKAGDRIEGLAKLRSPSAPVAPGAFDFQRYAYFKRIGAVGFFFDDVSIIQEGQRSNIALWLEDLRQTIGARLSIVMDNTSGSATASALLTGEKKAISEADVTAMRDAGLAHMLAISGLHLGLVAGTVFFAVRALLAMFERMALYYPIKKIAALIALLGAFLYMVLVGAPVPTQRAFLMTGIVLLAVMLDRSPISLRLVALAACVVLVIAPESIMGPSFQMSFAAVTCLIAAYEWARPIMQKWRRNAGWLTKTMFYFTAVLFTTLIASTATAPVALYHFQHMAVYSMAGNILAMPLLTFITMPFGILGLILMPAGLDYYPFQIMEWSIVQILSIAHGVAGYEHAVLNPGQMPAAAFGWGMCGALFLILWQGRLRWLGMLAIVIAILLTATHKMPDILIADDSELFAAHADESGLILSSGRANSFTRDAWQQLYGQKQEIQWPQEGQSSALERFTCDLYGCHWHYKNQKIAFAFIEKALPEDCRWADILISREPVFIKPCQSHIVIDKFDTWRNGAHAIFIDKRNGVIDVKTIAKERGNRPWVIRK